MQCDKASTGNMALHRGNFKFVEASWKRQPSEALNAYRHYFGMLDFEYERQTLTAFETIEKFSWNVKNELCQFIGFLVRTFVNDDSDMILWV